MKKLTSMLLLVFYSAVSLAQQDTPGKRLIMVTLDGFRWQEMFRGAEESILANRRYCPIQDSVARYQGKSKSEKRQNLLPFFWNTIASNGQLYGNRDQENTINCSNPYWFSYPGYHELFVGAVNKKVCSNAKIQNPNSTVFEFLNDHPFFKNSIAAFSTWDAFPFILRETRSGISVNAGLECTGEPETLTSGERQLNDRLSGTGYRTDSITFYMGFEYLKKKRPRVLYLAFDETDHFAHKARYDLYLDAAHRADQWLGQLWDWIQSDPEYRGRTTLLISTDHGRGHTLAKSWRHHGRLTFGSGQIWMAAIGPDVMPLGEMAGGPQLYQKQIAGTMAALLGLNYVNEFAVGETIHSVIKPAVLVADAHP